MFPRLAFAVALASAACEPSFDDGHLLDELRILAVRAEPPEASVGQTVTLQALAITTPELPATVHMWQCAARSGMRQGCEDFEDSIDLGEGITTAMEIGPAWRDRLDQVGLPVHQVVTVIARTDAEEERAIKRIVISDEPLKNHNPVLQALLLEDEEQEGAGAFEAERGEAIAIHPILAEDAAEHYDRIDLGGERVPAVEQFFVSYYYGCGHAPTLKSGEPDQLGGTFRAPEAAGRCSLYAILRDDRGGVDWRAREVLVR